MTKPEQDPPQKSGGVFIDMEEARKRLPEDIKQLAANIVKARREAQTSLGLDNQSCRNIR